MFYQAYGHQFNGYKCLSMYREFLLILATFVAKVIVNFLVGHDLNIIIVNQIYSNTKNLETKFSISIETHL